MVHGGVLISKKRRRGVCVWVPSMWEEGEGLREWGI